MVLEMAKSVPARGAVERRLDRLKSQLLDVLIEESEEELAPALCHAANEAAALAWLTPFPTLVFPVLFEELADTVRRRAQHQQEIWRRCWESKRAPLKIQPLVVPRPTFELLRLAV